MHSPTHSPSAFSSTAMDNTQSCGYGGFATPLYLIFEDTLSAGLAINDIPECYFVICMLHRLLCEDLRRPKSYTAMTKVIIPNIPVLEILLTDAHLISFSASSISVLECLCEEDT